MGLIKDSKLKLIRSLYYDKQMSIAQIARHLGVSIDATFYFFRHHNLKRRGKKEQQAAAFSRKPLSFKLKNKLTVSDKELKSLGVTLYWGEGYKAGETVDFANSDPAMIRVFLNFLRKICGIDKSRLRVYMYCYSNQHPDDLIVYWSGITAIPIQQFTKPYIRHDYQLGKEDKMRYGLIHIRYGDKKLWQILIKWIDEYKSRYA